MAAMPIARALVIAAALAAYALGSHWLMLHAAGEAWAILALCAPMLLVVAGIALARRDGVSLTACIALGVLLALAVARGGAGDANRLYVLQHAGAHLALAAWFGATLRPGRTALITALAERVHAAVTPAMRSYTRRLTAIWVIYFVAMAAISGALYAVAPWSWWSLFGNLLTPLAAGALFVGEHAVRYRLHPEFERASIAQALRAYRQTSAAGKGAR